jgi:hypothetical protein
VIEKAHETSGFLQTRQRACTPAKMRAVHDARVTRGVTKVYADCRSASSGQRVSGTAQARMRKTAQEE